MSDYEGSALSHAVNDATLMGEALLDAGFEVHESHDPSKEEILADLRELKEKVVRERFDTVVFYFAGHGVQRDSTQYLIMSSVDPARVEESSRGLLALDDVVEALGHGDVFVGIIDACRSGSSADGRGAGFRMSPRTRLRAELYLIFSTTPNSSALDGQGGNSFFTRTLSDNLRAPGRTLTESFQATSRAVRDRYDGVLFPCQYSTAAADIVVTPLSPSANVSETDIVVYPEVQTVLPAYCASDQSCSATLFVSGWGRSEANVPVKRRAAKPDDSNEASGRGSRDSRAVDEAVGPECDVDPRACMNPGDVGPESRHSRPTRDWLGFGLTIGGGATLATGVGVSMGWWTIRSQAQANVEAGGEPFAEGTMNRAHYLAGEEERARRFLIAGSVVVGVGLATAILGVAHLALHRFHHREISAFRMEPRVSVGAGGAALHLRF